MHIQIVTFKLMDMSDPDFRSACESLANLFVDVTGLISEVWMADAASNTYGGVSLWSDRESMERFLRGDLFTAISASPNLSDIRSRDFQVLEGPSRTTRGL